MAALGVALKNRGHTLNVRGQTDEAVSDFTRAVSLYEALVERHGETDLNAQFARSLIPLAWIHAAHPDTARRDGAKARAYAVRAWVLTDWKAHAPLETLAAAWAESGNFKEAIRWQQNAVALTPPARKKAAEARLALYQSDRPYRVQ